MTTTLLTIFIAILFVAFMVFGLSITLIRKGHHIQGEVGENDEMKKRGIKCTSQTILEEERALRGENCDLDQLACSLGSCSTCSDDQKEKVHGKPSAEKRT